MGKSMTEISNTVWLKFFRKMMFSGNIWMLFLQNIWGLCTSINAEGEILWQFAVNVWVE
jgi:hypothetical protein